MLTDFTAAHVGNLAGNTFVITGGNTGVGFETAKVLAARGARVVLGCRNRQKADEAAQEIRAQWPKADIGHVTIDLADQNSVRDAANQLLDDESVDVLINNAGVYGPDRTITKDGYELHMAVNHLGHFTLTALLLPALTETPGSRIVLTSSVGHRRGKEPFDDMLRIKHYEAFQAYADSKLANLWHMFELDRRLRAANAPTQAVACHPGVSETEILRDLNPWKYRVFKLGSPLFNTPDRAAWPTLAAATAPEVRGGDYIGPTGVGQMRGPAGTVQASELAVSRDAGRRMWDISIELTGIDPGI